MVMNRTNTALPFWGTAKKQIMEGQPQTWPYRKVIFSKATTKIIITTIKQTCQFMKILQEVYLSMSVCSVAQLLLKMLSALLVEEVYFSKLNQIKINSSLLIRKAILEFWPP